MTMYGIFMPFNIISTSFFIHSWYGGIESEEALHRAGEAMGVPFLICSILVPIIGLLIDKYGKRGYALSMSASLAFLSFLLFLNINPIYGLFVFGVSFSIFAAVIWPSLALVVPPSLMGFAFGLTTSLQNGAISLLPLIVIYVFTITGSYSKTLMLFLFNSMIAIFISVIIVMYDLSFNNILHRTDPINAVSANSKNKEEAKEANDINPDLKKK